MFIDGQRDCVRSIQFALSGCKGLLELLSSRITHLIETAHVGNKTMLIEQRERTEQETSRTRQAELLKARLRRRDEVQTEAETPEAKTAGESLSETARVHKIQQHMRAFHSPGSSLLLLPQLPLPPPYFLTFPCAAPACHALASIPAIGPFPRLSERRISGCYQPDHLWAPLQFPAMIYPMPYRHPNCPVYLCFSAPARLGGKILRCRLCCKCDPSCQSPLKPRLLAGHPRELGAT
jgi:hypothetical protein